MSTSETTGSKRSSSSATSDQDWIAQDQSRRVNELLSRPYTPAELRAAESDPINHPSHYADGWSNGAEVIDITEHLNFNKGNAVKYLARAGRKDPARELEDLHKAAWYVQREIARLVNA